MHNQRRAGCKFTLYGDACDCGSSETEWRLDSQRKEIERLRADKELDDTTITRLCLQKRELIEMLERAKETLELCDQQGPVARIAKLLKQVRS